MTRRREEVETPIAEEVDGLEPANDQVRSAEIEFPHGPAGELARQDWRRGILGIAWVEGCLDARTCDEGCRWRK